MLDGFNVGRPLARHDGVLVKMTDDGILARFVSPAQALRAALSMLEAARHPGLELQAGVHAAKVELRGDDIVCLAVHSRREPVPWGPTRCS